jgi:hypothetical protein
MSYMYEIPHIGYERTDRLFHKKELSQLTWQTRVAQLIKKLPHLLRNPKVHYCLQEPTTGPFFQKMNSVHTHITYLRYVLIRPSHLHLGLQRILFLQLSQLKFHIHFTLPSCVLPNNNHKKKQFREKCAVTCSENGWL